MSKLFVSLSGKKTELLVLLESVFNILIYGLRYWSKFEGDAGLTIAANRTFAQMS